MNIAEYNHFTVHNAMEIKSIAEQLLKMALIGYSLDINEEYTSSNSTSHKLISDPKESDRLINQHHNCIHIRNTVIGQTMHYEYFEDEDECIIIVYDQISLPTVVQNTILNFLNGYLYITISIKKGIFTATLVNENEMFSETGCQDLITFTKDELNILGINEQRIIDDIHNINS
jgi:hypothetical protein